MFITGHDELEQLTFDWKTVAPGMLSGKCCATGTCDNQPIPSNQLGKSLPYILEDYDLVDAKIIKQKFGVLRQAA